MRAGIQIARRAAAGRAAAFILAVASSGAALAVSLALVPIGGDDSIPGLLFLGAVGLSGWYGGLGPASHELRTPLSAIKASVYPLHDGTFELSAERRERLVSNIESEADRLIHFVSAALALGRLQNGLSPRWERIPPAEVYARMRTTKILAR